MSPSSTSQLASVEKDMLKANIPDFRPGDSIRVHAKIVEGTKERVQIFEGVVIKRHKGTKASATFTVRKVSYNIGVERTFLLHSPRIEKIEIVSRGDVRRARLFYLRPLRGKSARIKGRYDHEAAEQTAPANENEAHATTGQEVEENGNTAKSAKKKKKGPGGASPADSAAESAQGA